MSASEQLDISRIQVDILDDANKWRRQEPEISQLERDMEMAWADVTPAAPIETNNGLLQDTLRSAHLDPHVPVESRFGIRLFKRLLRKLTFWYVRYVTDQFNTFAGVLARWVRRHEERLVSVETAIVQASTSPRRSSSHLHNTLPSPSTVLAEQIAALTCPGQSVVLSGGIGTIVEAINNGGGTAYGVESSTSCLLTSLERRIDVRKGDIDAHLASSRTSEFETIVFAETVELFSLTQTQYLIEQAVRTLSCKGRIIVAVADPGSRTQIHSELYAGLGISPHTWNYLLSDAGMHVRTESTQDERITDIVVAERPAQALEYRSNASQPAVGAVKGTQVSKRTTVDILVPRMLSGDATSNHTRQLRDIIEGKGIDVRIVAEAVEAGNPEAISIDDWTYEGNHLILQHSIGSPLATRAIQEQASVILNYHNITPSHFFHPWHSGLKGSVELGRQQLRELATCTRRAIADSEFNALELRRLGYEDVVVSPVLFELPSSKPQRNQFTSTVPGDSGTILVVGRVAPNKCLQDIIFAFALLARRRSRARLLLVGGESPAEYLDSLRALARRLEVSDQVIFAGKVSDDELLQCYAIADVFACTSEHEGFGVPLVEAMANGLPVVAFDAAAVSETVGGAGIVLADKRPATLASAFDRVLGDQDLRSSLSERSIASAQRFDISVTREKMWMALEDLLLG